MSVPAWVSHTGSCTEVGSSEPVVTTSGPASGGVCADRARTTPTGHGAGRVADRVEVSVEGGAVECDTDRRGDRRLGEHPATCSRARRGHSSVPRLGRSLRRRLRRHRVALGIVPGSVAYFGLAASPGAHPASTATVMIIAAATRWGPGKRHAAQSSEARSPVRWPGAQVQVAVVVGERSGRYCRSGWPPDRLPRYHPRRAAGHQASGPPSGPVRRAGCASTMSPEQGRAALAQHAVAGPRRASSASTAAGSTTIGSPVDASITSAWPAAVPGLP